MLTSSMPRALPYMGYIGMSGPKEYSFSAVLVMNRVSILADFGYFCHIFVKGYSFSAVLVMNS